MITGILLALPLLFASALFLLKKKDHIRWLALTGSLFTFLYSLYVLIIFLTQCHCQLMLDLGWIPSLGVNFRFGMDGISMLLTLLTTFLTPVIIFSSLKHDYDRPASFYGLILLIETAFIGVFTAFDGLVFYVFWEMALIPAYFLCAVWGGNNRIRITFKFFIYTFTGSLFMLVALIYLYFQTPAPHSFDIRYLYMAALTPKAQVWVAIAFFLAFAIKIPIFPFHTWQPDTYTQSPPEGTMILSGIMLKMGIYGLIRFLLPICGTVMREWGWIAMLLTLTGIVYASIIAIRQDDMKRLIAYSSIAHAGLISAGIFALNLNGLEGSVIQMISHGINIVGLFIIIDLIEKKTGTRSISALGGISTVAPRLAALFMVILLASIGLPATNGFIGEFLILLGIFQHQPWMAAIAGLTVILSAVYMLRMYQRTMFGNTVPATVTVSDISWKEALPLLPLVVMIVWIGIFPGFFLRAVEIPLREILYLVKP